MLSRGARCWECPLIDKTPVLPAPVRSNHRLTIVGEGPGATEELTKRYWTGSAGALLWRLAKRAGFTEDDVYSTNACKCRTNQGMTAAELRKAVDCCRPALSKELAHAPVVLALLGARALQAITGKHKIRDWAGGHDHGVTFYRDSKGRVRPQEPHQASRRATPDADFSRHTIVIPSLHPAYALSNRYPQFQSAIAIFLQRAWRFATGALEPWRWPTTIIKEGPELIESLAHILHSDKIAGIDVETSGINVFKSDLLCIGIGNKDVFACVDWPVIDSKADTLIRQICQKRGVRLALQNGQFDFLSLETHGVQLNYDTTVFDTLEMHKILAPSMWHDLGSILALECHASRWKAEFKDTSDDAGSVQFIQADREERNTYCARDAGMTGWVVGPLWQRAQNFPRFRERYRDSMQLIQIAIKMKRHGFRTQIANFERHRRQLGDRIVKAEQSLVDTARYFGHDNFDCNSTDCIREMFTHHLGVQPMKWTKSGAPSFDADVLVQLAGTAGPASDFAKKLLTFRRYTKLKATYLDGLEIDECGRIHATWGPKKAKTARWACQDPNLMNIPKPRVKMDDVKKEPLG